MKGPNREYDEAVAEGARHHASSKTYSGSFLRPHKPWLSEMIERLECQSATDVGTGKGAQWLWIDPIDGKTMEQAWGFDVFKHDPCYPPYAAEPDGPSDLVICTHTISLIPLSALEWFTRRLFALSTKGTFIAEKIGKRKKHEVDDISTRAIGWSAKQWMNWIGTFAPEYPHLEIVLSIMDRIGHHKITTRYVWRDGEFAEAIEFDNGEA